MVLIGSFLGSVLASVAGCFVALLLLRRFEVLDKPNARSSHSVPTVRGLGIGIIAALILSSAIAIEQHSLLSVVVLGCTALLAALSFIDDLVSLPAIVRFSGHLGASLAVCLLLIFAPGGNPFGAIQLLTCGLAIVFVCGYTNAFNFMDGINGLAGFQGVITAGGMAWLALLAGATSDASPVVLALSISGACAGFLPYNFPKARGFMGDVASAPLGFLLAVLCLWIARDFGPWLIVPLLMLHANFILDTGVTLLRRILRGDRWHEAHREHFYQRLIRSGASHSFVAGMQVVLQLICLCLALLYVVTPSLWVQVSCLVGVLSLWCGFFVFADYRFRFSEAGRSAEIRA